MVSSSSELGSDRAGVSDELVGDLVQRNFGDIEPVGEDQLQQQVEGALEIGQPDLKAVLRGCFRDHVLKFTHRSGR